MSQQALGADGPRLALIGGPSERQGGPGLDDTQPTAEGHQEWLLDESLTETFPASDAISPAQAQFPRGKDAPSSFKQVAQYTDRFFRGN